jgi:hypothetical protein
MILNSEYIIITRSFLNLTKKLFYHRPTAPGNQTFERFLVGFSDPRPWFHLLTQLSPLISGVNRGCQGKGRKRDANSWWYIRASQPGLIPGYLLISAVIKVLMYTVNSCVGWTGALRAEKGSCDGPTLAPPSCHITTCLLSQEFALLPVHHISIYVFSARSSSIHSLID